MSKQEVQVQQDNAKLEKLYTKSEVKVRKTISIFEGIVLGALATLTTGVILNKAAKINVTDTTTRIVDSGIDKVKSIPNKFKKEKIEEN
jgi:hypothetical protein